jgi:hypothetical protein
VTGQGPRTPALAVWLALSGVLPFLALAAGALFAVLDRSVLTQAAIFYAAIVAGFTGGVRWGAELARAPDRPDAARLAVAGLMTVPAWGALLLIGQPTLAIGLLTLAGLGQLAWDIAGARAGLLPAWTARLRIGLTLVALACLAFIGFHVAPR